MFAEGSLCILIQFCRFANTPAGPAVFSRSASHVSKTAQYFGGSLALIAGSIGCAFVAVIVQYEA